MKLLLWANSHPAAIINPHVFGSKAVRGQTLSMIKLGVSPVSFAELPVEARALLFIFALGAAARYVGHPPSQSELTPVLETIWNRNRLCPSDLANPFHMIALLETELSSTRFAGGAQ
jgi:hypothetical protein